MLQQHQSYVDWWFSLVFVLLQHIFKGVILGQDLWLRQPETLGWGGAGSENTGPSGTGSGSGLDWAGLDFVKGAERRPLAPAQTLVVGKLVQALAQIMVVWTATVQEGGPRSHFFWQPRLTWGTGIGERTAWTLASLTRGTETGARTSSGMALGEASQPTYNTHKKKVLESKQCYTWPAQIPHRLFLL